MKIEYREKKCRENTNLNNLIRVPTDFFFPIQSEGKKKSWDLCTQKKLRQIDNKLCKISTKLRVSSISILILISIILLSNNVYSLGIATTRKTFDFEPNAKLQGTFIIVNNEQKDLRVFISARGEIAQYVTLHDAIVTFKPEESQKSFNYDLNLPASFDKPGTHTGEIVVTEIPKGAEEGGTFIGTTLAVVSEIKIRVPYPGKYAETKLEVSEANVNETVTFIVPVMNLGEEDIAKTKGNIRILGPTNEELAKLDTDEKSVKAKTTEELKTSWLAEVNPGVYYAHLRLSYDDKLAQAEKTFVVGNLMIDVLNVSVKDFKLGGIAKFRILLANKWNQPIDNIFAEIIIENNKGDQVAQIKSATTSIAALSQGELFAFWDTEGMAEGGYNARLIIHYADKTTEKQIKLVVALDRIDTFLPGATAKAIQKETAKQMTRDTWLMILVFVLIIVNIGWFVYMRRSKK